MVDDEVVLLLFSVVGKDVQNEADGDFLVKVLLQFA